jgi:hypothetical protein
MSNTQTHMHECRNVCVCVCLHMFGEPSRMGESERQCGHFEEENKLLPLPGIEAFCLKPTNPWSS